MRLGQLHPGVTRGDGPLQEIDPFVQLLELRLDLMDRRVVDEAGWTSTLDALRERARDGPEDPDEHPAGREQAAEVYEREIVHGSQPR